MLHTLQIFTLSLNQRTFIFKLCSQLGDKQLILLDLSESRLSLLSDHLIHLSKSSLKYFYDTRELLNVFSVLSLECVHRLEMALAEPGEFLLEERRGEWSCFFSESGSWLFG